MLSCFCLWRSVVRSVLDSVVLTRFFIFAFVLSLPATSQAITLYRTTSAPPGTIGFDNKADACGALIGWWNASGHWDQPSAGYSAVFWVVETDPNCVSWWLYEHNGIALYGTPKQFGVTGYISSSYCEEGEDWDNAAQECVTPPAAPTPVPDNGPSPCKSPTPQPATP